MEDPSKRIAAVLFSVAVIASVAGVVTQTALDALPKPTLVKRESRVSYSANPPKQEATIAAVKAIPATPTPSPTPEPTVIPTPLPTPAPTIAPVVIPTAVPVQVPVVSGSHTDWMAAAGIAPNDYPYVEFIVQHESGWRVGATNPSSGACGLMQFLPCSVEKAGANWNDPVNALTRGQQYAVSRYGSWKQAYEFWLTHRYW